MKYKFEGIGEAQAAVIMAALGANPSTAFLAAGFAGKIVFWVAKYFCMLLANCGLILLNVGAAKVMTIVEENNFVGAWDDADAIIAKIHATGREVLTDEEIKNIDGPVIDAFRKFASFARLRKRPNT